MGLFGFGFMEPDINAEVQTCRATEGSLLVDVRDEGEFAEGHIPGAINLPLPQVLAAQGLPPRKDVPLCVYCRSGARSARAVQALRQLGYAGARNIGGITAWRGELEP
ncbi:rhodanese-like domain-containing protein [Olsenella urininfantis]|uniref:rhodanese-like domain-containing protein n=1 Tax=Olsenella urininfantis TaxID=1871033 RepID=UPI000986F18B|nr:rhodanese-like domain-containing protein [Olsenella urininfantis]